MNPITAPVNPQDQTLIQIGNAILAVSAEDALRIQAELAELALKRAPIEAAAQKRISDSISLLVLGRASSKPNPSGSVFFSMLILRLKKEASWSVDTMATDGKKLYYNPEFTMSLTAPETVGVLVHEVLHCALKHFARKGDREHQRFNIAADCAINPVVLESGFKLPAEGLFPGTGGKMPSNLEPAQQAEWNKFNEIIKALPPGLTMEEYYNRLPVDTEKKGGKSDPGRCGEVKPAPDNKDGKSAASALESEWDLISAQAAQAALRRSKEKGDMPGFLQELLTEILKPRVDWKQQLADFFDRVVKGEYSWTRPNRRHVADGLYLPSMFAKGLGEVVIMVDTSGSVYTKEVLDAFASELDGILQLCPCKAVVIYHHVEAYKVTEWSAMEGDFVLAPGESGGTSHVPAFAKVDELVDEGVLDGPPSCVVCLTDMESSFPEDPGYPVLWASTGSGDECPFGTLVKVDLQ